MTDAAELVKLADPRMKAIYDKLAAEGGGTWATYMMLDIEQAVAAQQDGAWQPIETAEADQALLVCNPDEGTLPVVAWKVAGTWYGPGGKRLDPLPKFWTRWAKLPRRLEQSPQRSDTKGQSS